MRNLPDSSDEDDEGDDGERKAVDPAETARKVEALASAVLEESDEDSSDAEEERPDPATKPDQADLMETLKLEALANSIDSESGDSEDEGSNEDYSSNVVIKDIPPSAGPGSKPDQVDLMETLKLEALANSIFEGGDSESEESEDAGCNEVDSSVGSSASSNVVDKVIQPSANFDDRDEATIKMSSLDKIDNMDVTTKVDSVDHADQILETHPKVLKSQVVETALPSLGSLQEMIESIENVHTVGLVDLTRDKKEDDFGEDNYGEVVVEMENNDISFSELFQNDEEAGNDYNAREEGVEKDEDVNDEDEDEDEEEDGDSEASSEEELPSDFHSLRDLSENYHDHLQQMLVLLQEQLERNLARQRQVDAELEELDVDQAKTAKAQGQHVSVTRKALSIFGYPYFKDRNLYHPPPNKDTLAKRASFELSPWIEFPRPFSKSDRSKLKKYVRHQAIELKTRSLRYEVQKLNHNMSSVFVEEEDKQEMTERLLECERELQGVKKLPEEKLFWDRYQEYDWDRISATDFKGLHSGLDCKLQWQNMLHPSINRAPFSADEDKLLKRFADSTGGQDWDAIARELGTQRTAHQVSISIAVNFVCAGVKKFLKKNFSGLCTKL